MIDSVVLSWPYYISDTIRYPGVKMSKHMKFRKDVRAEDMNFKVINTEDV